jgi:PAS domain S-box-containing protein
MQQQLGLSEDQMLGTEWLEVVHEDDREPIREEWRSAIRERRGFEVNQRVLQAAGAVTQLVVRVAPVWEDAELLGFVGCSVDMTERMSLEEQLRQAQKMEAIGRLAGGVAHDFNNMLAVINGYSELGLGYLEPQSRLEGPLREIKKAGERAATLTRQLLAFSRKQMLRPEILDLNRVVSDMHTMLSRLIGEDVLLGTRLALELGRISADPGQIEQVILNLVVNARDAMPRGGRLTLSTDNVWLDAASLRPHAGQQPGPYVVLEVSDTGCGMAPHVQARIFEPFFTTKGLGEGTGLGLATVYGIVTQSGGHLEVASTPEVGTVFRVYLPNVGGSVAAEVSGTAAPEPPRGAETILLVEDEEMVRTLIRTVLEGRGYRVLEVASSEELDRLRTQLPETIDLLLTDVVMPTRSGPEVAELLRQDYPQLKVLFMSGYTDDAVLRHGVCTAETAFLQKPFSPLVLAQKVRELLG